jgi:hypothetical protein
MFVGLIKARSEKYSELVELARKMINAENVYSKA